MGEGHARFTVGDFDCLAVSDGAVVCGPPDDPLPAAVLFANAASTDVDALLREAGQTLPWTHWTEEMTCLLVDTGRQRILIDAGAGELDPGTGRLVRNLAGAGVAPSDIDVVILSHSHADHVGGLVARDGSPVFSEARILLSRKEWDFWMNAQAERALPRETGAFLVEFARRTLPLLEEHLEFLDGEAEPSRGVRCRPTSGHTPGHLAVELSSRGQRLLFVADLLLHPLHVQRPDWYSAVDVDPVLLTQTRRALLARAADEGCLVHAFHFPFPGLGRVRATNTGYAWAGAS